MEYEEIVAEVRQASGGIGSEAAEARSAQVMGQPVLRKEDARAHASHAVRSVA